MAKLPTVTNIEIKDLICSWDHVPGAKAYRLWINGGGTNGGTIPGLWPSMIIPAPVPPPQEGPVDLLPKQVISVDLLKAGHKDAELKAGMTLEVNVYAIPADPKDADSDVATQGFTLNHKGAEKIRLLSMEKRMTERLARLGEFEKELAALKNRIAATASADELQRLRATVSTMATEVNGLKNMAGDVKAVKESQVLVGRILTEIQEKLDDMAAKKPSASSRAPSHAPSHAPSQPPVPSATQPGATPGGPGQQPVSTPSPAPSQPPTPGQQPATPPTPQTPQQQQGGKLGKIWAAASGQLTLVAILAITLVVILGIIGVTLYVMYRSSPGPSLDTGLMMQANGLNDLNRMKMRLESEYDAWKLSTLKPPQPAPVATNAAILPRVINNITVIVTNPPSVLAYHDQQPRGRETSWNMYATVPTYASYPAYYGGGIAFAHHQPGIPVGAMFSGGYSQPFRGGHHPHR